MSTDERANPFLCSEWILQRVQATDILVLVAAVTARGASTLWAKFDSPNGADSPNHMLFGLVVGIKKFVRRYKR